MTPNIFVENPSILHIPSNREPLSSDVFFLSEGEITWVFDCGALPEIAEEISKLPGEKRLVISHFHADHTLNLLRSNLEFAKIYATAYTTQHLREPDRFNRETVEIITEETKVSDHVTLIPLRSSHAKGCLTLLFHQKYLFMGDAIYGSLKGGESSYNAQVLLEEIRQLQNVEAEYFCPSHRLNPLCRKEGILTFLEFVYQKREKNVPTIIL